MDWEQIDNIKSDMREKFSDEFYSIDDVVSFVRGYKHIPADATAVVLSRQNDYYAVVVKSEYIEGVHKSFLKRRR